MYFIYLFIILKLKIFYLFNDIFLKNIKKCEALIDNI